jgi:DNA-binding response OmpR family regulator
MAKILIVDDDVDLVEALKVVLEKRGHSVDFAYDGEAGYKKALEGSPDLVILDIMMKTKDEGFQVCYRLKNKPPTASIPILILTAVGKETGLRFGKEDEEFFCADDIAEKPVKPHELLEKVAKLVKE